MSRQFFDDIFGKQEGNVKVDGLVDSTSTIDFDEKLSALEEVWNEREKPHCGQGDPQFYAYFKNVKAEVVRHHMRKDLHEAVGLGSPPQIFTTNASEAINSILKKQVCYKKTQWPRFVEEMKQFVESQRDKTIRSLSGRGRYRLAEPFRCLSVEEWSKMRSGQSSASQDGLSTLNPRSSQSSSLTKSLSISAEESGIHMIPFVTHSHVVQSRVTGER